MLNKFQVKKCSNSSKRRSEQYSKVVEYTVQSNTSGLDSNKEVIAKLNEKLRKIYIVIYHIISKQFDKNDDYKGTFFNVVCLSCIKDILDGVNYIQSVLDLSIGCQVTSLSILSNEVIVNQRDVFCTTCVDRMINLRGVSSQEENKTTVTSKQDISVDTTPVIQKNIIDLGIPSTSTQGNSSIIEKQVVTSTKEYVVNKKNSELVFVVRQRRVVTDLVGKVQVIIGSLLHIFNYTSSRRNKAKKENIMNRPVILVRLFRLDLEVNKVITLMSRLCIMLAELSNQLNVTVLNRGSNQATGRANLPFHDSVEKFGRAFTLNRVRGKKKRAMLKSSNSFSGVCTLSMIAEEDSTDKCCVFAQENIPQSNEEHVNGNSVRGSDTFDPFSPDTASKINEFYIWNSIASDAGKEALIRTLILEVGSKDQLLRILSTEVDMDKLIEIFPKTFAYQSNNIRSTNICTAKRQLLNKSLDYRLYPTLRSFIFYINNNYTKNLQPVIQDVKSVGNIVTIPSSESNETVDPILVDKGQILTDETNINDVMVGTIESISTVKSLVTLGNLNNIDDDTIVFIDEEESTIVPTLSKEICSIESTQNHESIYEKSGSDNVELKSCVNVKTDKAKKVVKYDDVISSASDDSAVELCNGAKDVIRRVNSGKTSTKTESRPNNILFSDINTLVLPNTLDNLAASTDDSVESFKKCVSKVATDSNNVSYDSHREPCCNDEDISTNLTDTACTNSCLIASKADDPQDFIRKKSEDSKSVFNLSVGRISMGVCNFLVIQCMLHKENREELLSRLISNVGSKDQLIKILVAEIGRNMLLKIFPSISVSDIDSSLSNELHDVVVKDKNGIFVKYDDSHNVQIVYLLQVFIDYVLKNKQYICGEQGPESISKDVKLSKDMDCVSSDEILGSVKNNSSMTELSKVSKQDISFDHDKCYRSNTLPYKRTGNTFEVINRNITESSKCDDTGLHLEVVSSTEYCDDENMPSVSAICNTELSMQSVTDHDKSTTKSKSISSFPCQSFVLTKTVSRLSSFSSMRGKNKSFSSVVTLDNKQDSIETIGSEVVVDGNVSEGVGKNSGSNACDITSKHSEKNSSSIFKISNSFFHRNKVSKDEELGKFVQDLVMQLHNTVYGIGRLTDHLSLQGNYIFFNWIMSCIIRSSDFEKCEAMIINDIRPCCAYYKTIISIPNAKISSLYIKSLHDLSWIDSQVRPLHSLVHKGKIDGISFSVSKDHVRREARKHMSTINEELVIKLRELFSVFDIECITEEDLSLFLVQGRLVISGKHLSSIPDGVILRIMSYKDIVIKGDIPKGLQIDCQNIKVYGTVKGRLISADGLIEIYGPVYGSIICKSVCKSDLTGVMIQGDVDKYASILCTNGNIEIYGNNVCGNISAQDTEMIIKSDMFMGSIFSDGGIYLYFSCKTNNVLWLKLNNIKNVFVDCNLKVKCMFAFGSKFYVRKGKGFRLNDRCRDCEVFSLSSKFWRFELSELKNLIKMNVTGEVVDPLAMELQHVNNTVEGVVVNPVDSESAIFNCAHK
ncbi:hypothetical protein [Ehrlichia ruminantium]|uniref:hypothetical protein n=1 Tax=Ehrlichia ruminantium TaxID=779 RepID=UPI0015DC9D34|nr:hypothetical protein [Ehrlichia ruminantium]QLK57595.1 DUF342 domain-containing protein [Ehrlichia ruminantium]UOD98057.1 hypothetical protein IMW64_00980 [Ehrlichia ruminantium]